jgi:hypothetical protein
MNLAIGMTTCKRPDYPYIARSFSDLMKTGLINDNRRLQLFAEPEHDFDRVWPPHLRPPWVDCHVAIEKLGCFPNWKRALTWLIANTDADWLMVVQDDVVYRSDVLARLEAGAEEFQFIGALSPYCSVAMVEPESWDTVEGWGQARFYNNAFWGALTLCFSRSVAEALLAFPRFRAHDHHRKIDVVVGNCLRDMGLPLIVHRPSLCDHIGERSTIGRDRIRGNAWGRRGLLWRQEP